MVNYEKWEGEDREKWEGNEIERKRKGEKE
jgi:hypothetical protein